jgi:hypothetical protein
VSRMRCNVPRSRLPSPAEPAGRRKGCRINHFVSLTKKMFAIRSNKTSHRAFNICLSPVKLTARICCVIVSFLIQSEKNSRFVNHPGSLNCKRSSLVEMILQQGMRAIASKFVAEESCSLNIVRTPNTSCIRPPGYILVKQ